MSPLASYLLAFILAFAPPPKPSEEAVELERLSEIAADVDAVVSDPNEPPLFDGANGRARTGLLLLSMAKSESDFAEHIDHGRCLPHECDHGHAATMWQLHTDGGIALDGVRYRYWWAGGDGPFFRGPDLVADRRLAVRVVLHVLRGPHTVGWDGPQRRARAEFWAAKHPF